MDNNELNNIPEEELDQEPESVVTVPDPFEVAVLDGIRQTNYLLSFILCFLIMTMMLMVRKKKG